MGEGELKDLRELHELVEFLKASGVAKFDMERPDLKIRLTFAQPGTAEPASGSMGGLDLSQLARFMAAAGAANAAQPVASAEVASVHAAVALPETVAAAAAGSAVPDEDAGLHVVKSPLVGTFYDAAAPGADAFVRVGDTVSVGKVLCIVEAMKIMNEIESDAAGEIVKIHVKPGQPVEYGQSLFSVRT